MQLNIHPALPLFAGTALSVWAAGRGLQRTLRRYDLAPRPLDKTETVLYWSVLLTCSFLVCVEIVPPGTAAASLGIACLGFIMWPPLARYAIVGLRSIRVLPAVRRNEEEGNRL